MRLLWDSFAGGGFFLHTYLMNGPKGSYEYEFVIVHNVCLTVCLSVTKNDDFLQKNPQTLWSPSNEKNNEKFIGRTSYAFG